MNPPGTAPPDPHSEALRATLDSEFEILRPLGKGDTSVVYLARERALGRLVAIKVLRRATAADATVRKRFEREARAAATLSESQDIVGIHRYGTLEDGTPYLILRYVKGRTMRERLEAEGPLAVAEAREILLAVARALETAHAGGIVHRDLRPGNVLWDDERGRALLSDFGIAAVLETSNLDSARLTQTGQRVGNPRYMSPEQLRDEPLTEQADIYGFGVFAFELLTGEGPYAARTNAEHIRAHLSGEPRRLREMRPEVPADMADIVVRCLNREPLHRPTASALVQRLSGSQGTARGGASPDAAAEGDPTDPATLIRRRVPQIVGLAVVAGGGLVGFMSSLYERYEMPRWVFDVTIATAIAGVVASTVIAWFHGEKGPQEPTRKEFALLGLIGAGWLVASVLLILNGL